MATDRIDAEGTAVVFDPKLPASIEHVPSLACCDRAARPRMRGVPEETPVAFTFNGTTYAVMMATPADLTDFAVGFSLAEGVITGSADIESLEVIRHETGIELQMWLAPSRASALRDRRRNLAGPTGCGLCGVESLASVLPPIARVGEGFAIASEDVFDALSSLASAQHLLKETRALHAAAFWEPASGIVALREDVGRHNALDKLVGTLARTGRGGQSGAVIVTSRVSVEMIQKTAAIGAPIIIAVSAPTALAVRTAQGAGVTLIAIARDDGFEVFTHPERIRGRSNRRTRQLSRGRRAKAEF